MAHLDVYSGLAFSQSLTTSAITGETSCQVVWASEQDSSPDRWKIEKTETISNSAITLSLSASETAEFTHIRYCEVYYITAATGAKRFGFSYEVNLLKIAGSRDTTSTIPRNSLSFVKFGQAAIGAMQNTYEMPAASSISKITLTASNAPLTTPVTVEIYNNAAATGKTCTLAAGSATQSTTLATPLSVALGDDITCNITATGTSPDEGTNIIATVWYY